jgi:hypothetical protein
MTLTSGASKTKTDEPGLAASILRPAFMTLAGKEVSAIAAIVIEEES